MTETGGFEPTEAQDGVDDNPLILIDPEAIPYPLTDTWSLNYAAETLRSGGEDLAGGAEDMKSTWQGLQAHYSAPESETLFTKVDPVVTRGEDIQTDLGIAATALEDLAEAATTARRSLNTLKIEAQFFWNKHHDKKVWWLDKDDETDEWALLENIRLKDSVNTAWETFNEAETACANAITAMTGGPTFAAPDLASGDDIVYGLPTDAGEREIPSFGETFYDPANYFTEWAGTEFHPSLATFDNSNAQAVWDVVVTDALWGAAVGLVATSGAWHADVGWQFSTRGRVENMARTVRDAGLDAATMVGLHDDNGWLFSSGGDGQTDSGSTWDRWTTNIEASGVEIRESYTAWSRRDEDPAYSNSTMAANAALTVGGLPIKVVTSLLKLGPGGSASTHSPSDGSFSDSDGSTPGGRPGTGNWPSSPLRDPEQGSAPTRERFGDQCTELEESLLDPNQFRDTPGDQPSTPVYPSSPLPGNGGDQSPQGSTTPSPGENPPTKDSDTPSTSLGDKESPHHADDPDGQDAPRSRDEEGAAPNRHREDQGGPTAANTPTPTSTTRPETGPQRNDSDAPRDENNPEQRPQRRDDEGASGDQNDARPQRRDDGEDHGAPREEAQRPDLSTGGGGESGGDQPPRDRTGTGDDGGGAGGDRSRDQAGVPDPERQTKLARAERINERLLSGGLSQERIDRLRGDLPIEDRDWQRLYAAVNQPFREDLAPRLNPAAVDFAFDGARDSKEFAYRFEYFTATYIELAKELVSSGEFGRKSSKPEAANMILDENFDLQARLDADHIEVRSARPDHGPVLVNRDPGKLERSIQERAHELHMGHESSAAYHARKHPDAVPETEDTGNPVRDYLASAEKTLRDGRMVERTPVGGGTDKLVYTRPILDEDGLQVKDRKNRQLFLEAILYVRDDSSVVLATFDQKME